MLPILLTLLCIAGTPTSSTAEASLQTVAEKSNYQATARYDEVISFVDELKATCPLIRVAELGVSSEGRSIPLVIMADPPLTSPEQVADSGKLLAFAFGNIHAGEVCGKEALLMLAREIGTTADHPLLKDLIIVFAPIFNVDGNDKMSTTSRPGQVGPAKGQGQRPNAQGLDLNRDYMKLESPEVRALVRFFNEWDPAVVIDTHTTNGSFHQYLITYAAPRNPAGDPEIIKYVRDTMLPAVSAKMLAATGYKSFFYGNFDKQRQRWETYPALPRFGTPYRGLRNCIAILSEAYSHAPYRDRVLATRDFVRTILAHTAEHRDEIRDLIKAARKRTIEAGKEPQTDDLVAIRSEMAPFDKPVTIEGFVEEVKEGQAHATDQPRSYEVTHYGRFEPTLSVRRPYAYLFPSSYRPVVENLLRHGLDVEELREDLELDVEVYDLASVARAEKPFQKHRLVTVQTTVRTESRRFDAGTILVRTGQELGTLAVYLLEPQSDDGLCTWNFFDDALKQGAAFPVVRLLDAVPLTSGGVKPLPEDRKFNQPLNFARVYESDNPPNLGGSPISGLRWLSDGEHFLQRRDKRLWIVHAATGRSRHFHNPDALADSLATLPTIDSKTAKKLADRTRFQMTEDRTATLFEHENDLYYAKMDGSLAARLTNTPQREELFSFSPDGSFVAFVRDFDLYVVDVATRTERALTTGGTSRVRNGKLDWVYYEELYGRRWRGYWWSPDSKDIAFLQIDDSTMPTFTVINEIPLHQEVEVTAYPKVGDPNPRVRVGMVSAAGGAARWADLGGYIDGGFLVPRVGWLPDSQTIYIYIQNRAQTWLDFLTVARSGGKPERLMRETTQAWVSNPGEPSYLKDGSFILPSERSGWKHLYRFNERGELQAQLTSGEWEARSLLYVDEDGGWVYFSGTRDSHIAANLYRVSIDGDKLERLTASDASHRASVSPNGKYFIDTYSDFRTPTRVDLRHADGKLVRRLDTNPVYALEEYRLGEYTLFQIETSDGFLLEASLLKPPDFDPQRKYPVWFMTYAGPHAPTIRNSWAGGRTRDRALAEMGFVVFRADPRSASGKGAISAWIAYQRLGVPELADIEEAIAWLKSQSFVDPQRIGISGHSYGGFMTAYAMTHSDSFAAGIAGAPITDWRNYDSIYTERYMNTPQANSQGYDETSVVAAAKDLQGRLLILHGVMDDNVHMQNTLQFVRELQKADKQFELMLYPGSRHRISGMHYNRLVFDFIQRTLGGTPSRQEAPVPTAAEAAATN